MDTDIAVAVEMEVLVIVSVNVIVEVEMEHFVVVWVAKEVETVVEVTGLVNVDVVIEVKIDGVTINAAVSVDVAIVVIVPVAVAVTVDVMMEGKHPVNDDAGQTNPVGNKSTKAFDSDVGKCTGTMTVQEEVAESLQGARIVRAVGKG